MNELHRKLLNTFRGESKEHLEKIRRRLETLESRPEEPRGADVEEIFRRAHSLKGAARVVDLGPIEQLSHGLETLFSRIQAGSMKFEKSTFKTVYAALDMMEDCMTALQQDKPMPETTQALEEVMKILGQALPQPDSPPKTPPTAPHHQVETPSAILESEEMVRVSMKSLDRLMRTSSQLLNERINQDRMIHELEPIGAKIAEIEKEWDRFRQTTARQFELSGVTSREAGQVGAYLNSVMEEIGRLSRLIRHIQHNQQQSSWTLRQLGEQLNENVREVRMVPAESVFQGFRKMVRDLSKDEGKEVDFRTTGLEVEADRLVLQALKDSVMHVLRNAITHGIEFPEIREKAGKSRTGSIHLRVATEGGRLHITVKDDGRGLDYQSIAKIAAKKGLITQEQAMEANPEILQPLLFQAAFSTAPMVTNLAGRGMGLSVVLEAVNRLQGEVRFVREEDSASGMTMRLSAPLTVSSHRLLLVRSKGRTYAVPVYAVEKLLHLKLHQIESFKGKLVVRLGDQPVPLVPLSQFLELGESSLELPANSSNIPVAVLKGGNRLLAVAVDSFESEVDTIVNDLGFPLSQIKALGGGMLHRDGSVVLVLNPAELLRAKVEPATLLQVKNEEQKKKKNPVIMVVDDSITTRTLEKGILESYGFQVVLAVDGLDGLEKMRQEPCDLAIVDVQMPRMDGFTLIDEMKKDKRLKDIPVIIVTSLDKREDKERGLALGANAYIVKGKFDHQGLLEAVHQIL